MIRQTKREKVLKGIIDDILWMAIRYAHGRHTFSPWTVRQAIKKLKVLYPKYKLKCDIIVVLPPTQEELNKYKNLDKNDWLNDLFDDDYDVAYKKLNEENKTIANEMNSEIVLPKD